MTIPITYLLIAFTCIVSIKAFSDRNLQYKMMLIPSRMEGGHQWYRLFSHAVVHQDYLHLFMNMFALFLFGHNTDAGGYGVETMYGQQFGLLKGTFYFVLLYVGGILLSAYPSFERNRKNTGYMSLGASGAVSAVVFAYIILDPLSQFSLFFIPYPRFPAWIFGFAYLLYSWYKSRKQTDNIDHYAHFWGAIYGIVFTLIIRPKNALDFIENIRYFFLNGNT